MKRSLFAGFLLLAVSVSAISDDEATLTTSAEAPPETLSGAIKETLRLQGHTVAINGTPTATLWFRSELPVRSEASNELGVSFGNLVESIFVGAVRLDSTWRDYKGNPVEAGLYTMRYAIQPADGNHMGVSLYRDFLLLIPADGDTNPDAEFDHDKVVSMSMDPAKLTHPSVLALFPVWEGVEVPALQKNDMDQWMLAMSFGALNLGLTVTGKGEH